MRDKNPIKVIRLQSRIVVGGPALHTILLSKRLSGNNFHTMLVGGGENPDEKSMLPIIQKEGIQYKIISEMGREIHFYDDIISLIKLYKLIKREKPDIVHTHTAKAGAIGRIAAYFANIPYIYHTFHGHVFHGYFGKTKTRIFILLERLLTKITTKIIVISEAQRDDIVNRYKIAQSSKVALIPLGFEWDAFFNRNFNQNLRKRFGISKEKFVIGIVGRITPIKDHILFVNIAEKLIKYNYEKFHFVIIGDGHGRSDVEMEIGNKGFDSFFTFTGWLKLDDCIYGDLDLLLLTSKNEGTPVAIIEALVAGTPVIASSVGGVPDVLKLYDEKYLIKGRNVDLYTSAIISLITSYKRVPDEVREKIKYQYNADRLEKDVKKLYLQHIY